MAAGQNLTKRSSTHIGTLALAMAMKHDPLLSRCEGGNLCGKSAPVAHQVPPLPQQRKTSICDNIYSFSHVGSATSSRNGAMEIITVAGAVLTQLHEDELGCMVESRK